jgi:RHS repeat-associated protein
MFAFALLTIAGAHASVRAELREGLSLVRRLARSLNGSLRSRIATVQYQWRFFNLECVPKPHEVATRGYTWQKFGQESRLKSVTQRDPSGANANDLTKNKTISYTLDGEGNRIEKQVQALDASGNPSGTPIKTKYVIDSNRGYAEAMAEIDFTNTASIAVQKINSFAPTGTGELIQIARSNGTYYPAHDALGSLQALADQSGNLIAAQSHDAWGANVKNVGLDINLANAATTPTTSFTEHGYTGERVDPDTGLVHLRAREYEPTSGRFVSMDPHPGKTTRPISLNDYVYASDDSPNMTGPTGLFSMGDIGASLNISGTLSSLSLPTASRSALAIASKAKIYDIYDYVTWPLHVYMVRRSKLTKVDLLRYDVGNDYGWAGVKRFNPFGVIPGGIVRASSVTPSQIDGKGVRVAEHSFGQWLLWHTTVVGTDTDECKLDDSLNPIKGTNCVSWTIWATAKAIAISKLKL